MKNAIITVCLALALASCCMAEVPEWRSTVVVRAEYGDGEDQFCYEGVVERHPPSDQPIPCFYVGDEGIFIIDGYQHNIKVFDLSGTFKRAISLEWEFPYKGVLPVSGLDMEVTGGVIYLLNMLSGHPRGDATKFYLFTIDLETGKQGDRIMIHIPTLGTALDGQEVGNTGRIIEEGEGTITVYDRVRKMSCPLIRNGRVIPAREQAIGIPGRKFGAGRVRYNPEKGSTEIVDYSDENTFCTCIGGPMATEGHGENILTATNMQKSEKHLISLIIYNDKCIEIGRIAVLIASRRGWVPLPPNDMFRFGADGELYELHVGNDAVYVYRWSP